MSSRTARALCATSKRGQSADSFTDTLGASSGDARARRAAPDGVDRRRVRREIALRVRGRQRRLAEHVERIVEFRRLRRAAQRALDRLAHDELRPENPHRLAQRGTHDGLADALDEPRKERRGRFLELGGAHDAPRQEQRPRRSVDEQRFALSQVCLPIRGTELVGNEPVRRVGIRNAQQRLGEAHQHDAFAGRQVVRAQQRVDAAGVSLTAADRRDERCGLVPDERGLRRRQRGATDELRERFRLVGEIALRDRGADGGRRGASRVEQPTARGSFGGAGHAPSLVRTRVRQPRGRA